MNDSLTIQPECFRWSELITQSSSGTFLGRTAEEWRDTTRRELNLRTDRLIIATGHQTLLWHPGILAKYLVTDALADAHDFATANLVVDQHAEGFGDFELPIRKPDGSLASKRIELLRSRHGVPMCKHPACKPDSFTNNFKIPLKSIEVGIKEIVTAVCAHSDQPNAALQMAHALADLMNRWVKPMPHVTASQLITTSLARAMLTAMHDDTERCITSYNRAVQRVPEAGIGPLAITANKHELPVWHIRNDDHRVHGCRNDVTTFLESPDNPPSLLPRALFMTALVRLGMCDLYVHGTGGANYDRAMELWVNDWLGAQPCPIGVATATLYLPLIEDSADTPHVHSAIASLRRAFHNPDSISKRDFLKQIESAPRNSSERRSLFFAMHEKLSTLRTHHADNISQAERTLKNAKRRVEEQRIALRRDWPFPLYPVEMIDELARDVAHCLGTQQHREPCGCVN